MSTIIELRDVSKRYLVDKREVQALQNINLTIEAGEVFALIGYSGAGKSTLLRLINGLERASSGEVIVEGRDISTFSERELLPVRQRTGMIFQQFNLFSSRTVSANVAYPLKTAGWPKAKREQRVAELLDFVGLLDKAHAYPDQLSGGQKQRVGIARALATNPPILLADEATSALDPETTADVLKLLARVNRELGITVVLVTHEMDVVRRIAERVAVMSDGQIVETGSAYEVFSNPQAKVTRNFVESSMHDKPSVEELERLRSRHPGTIIQTDVVDDAPIGAILSQANEHGVSFELLYGAISSLQSRSFGSLTIALTGAASGIAEVIAALREVTKVTEVE